MLNKLLNIVSNPKQYVPLAAKQFFQSFAYIFSKSPLFLQEQMNINKRSFWYSEDFVKHTGGFFILNDNVDRYIIDLLPCDLVRRDMLILLLRSINERSIEGDIAEVGVYKGVTAKLIHYYMPDRILHLFDTFSGFDERDIIKEKMDSTLLRGQFSETNVEMVLKYINPVNRNIRIYPGYFPDSACKENNHKHYAFVHLDVDMYQPTMEGLKYFYERVSKGGFILIHDYNAWLGARKAVDEFFQDRPEVVIPMPDKSGSALIVKQ